MREVLALMVGAIFLCPAFATADGDTDEDSAQTAAILNSLLWNSYMVDKDVAPGLTHLVFGDLNDDSQPDAVLTYSHGVGSKGGNQYSQRVAVFLSEDRRWELLHQLSIGSKGQRFLTPTQIKDGAVHFSVTYWQTGDAACCPTGTSETVFVLKGDTLQESSTPANF